MTFAVLSFATRAAPGRIRFRCDELRLDEERDLEPEPPFAGWARAYATGSWSREALLGIGLAIGQWLEGSQRWFTRLAEAAAPVTLVIETDKDPDAVEQAALAVPWELIARVRPERVSPARPAAPATAQSEAPPAVLQDLWAQLGPIDWEHVEHAALEPSFLLSVVRRLSSTTARLAPSAYRLSVVFMPCRPNGTALLLDVQEAAIRRASTGIAMDLEVEDSGSLEGLAALVARLGEHDVIHVSCPATQSPRPALAFEGPHDDSVAVSADDIWRAIARRPRLLVVSAYAAPPLARGAQARHAAAVGVGSEVLARLSTELCQRGWPAVLALPFTAGDDQAAIGGDFVVALYRQLAQQVSLLEAFARARMAAVDGDGGLWHSARLLLGPGGGGPLVDGVKPRPARSDVIWDQRFLDSNKQIPIADDYQARLHRRALQRVVTTLRDPASPGIAIHGADERSRATFVSHVLRRVEHELRRVVTVDAGPQGILRAIRMHTADATVAALIEQHRATVPDDARQLQEVLRAIVEGPCRSTGSGAFVLVLHNVDRVAAGPRAVVLRALLGAFAGAATASRLVLTCETPFSVVDEDGAEISQRLAWQALAASGHRAASVWGEQPRHDGPQSSDPTAPARRSRRSAQVAGIVAGLVALAGVALAVIPAHRRRLSTIDLGKMVRFEASDIRLGVFAGARPAGCSRPAGDDDCEQWRHPEIVGVTRVAAFDLDKHEVSNDDFAAWLNRDPDRWLSPGADGVVQDRHDQLPLLQTKSCFDSIAVTRTGQAQLASGAGQRPVVCVTWYGADKYCRELGKRLPLETEWELAAKGGDGRRFAWGGEPPRPGGVGYGTSGPRDVGTAAQDVSPEGIFDLAGNVAEWVSSDRDTPELRMIRGGSFLADGACYLLASKCARMPWLRFGRNVGFRCARSLPP